jgi:hypothetical protein
LLALGPNETPSQIASIFKKYIVNDHVAIREDTIPKQTLHR